jgi:hypothetical protein
MYKAEEILKTMDYNNDGKVCLKGTAYNLT